MLNAASVDDEVGSCVMHKRRAREVENGALATWREGSDVAEMETRCGLLAELWSTVASLSGRTRERRLNSARLIKFMILPWTRRGGSWADILGSKSDMPCVWRRRVLAAWEASRDAWPEPYVEANQVSSRADNRIEAVRKDE